MKIYSIYQKKSADFDLENIRLIKDGFSINAAIFQVFWCLYHRLWFYSLLILFLNITVAVLEIKGLTPTAFSLVFNLFLTIFIGLEASNWQEEKFKNNKNYRPQGIVTGISQTDALRRLLDKNEALR